MSEGLDFVFPLCWFLLWNERFPLETLMFGSCRPVLSQRLTLLRKQWPLEYMVNFFALIEPGLDFICFWVPFWKLLQWDFLFELSMSKEDPVHYRNLLPLDSVLEEAAPMMHWRTCSVIEWSSPIHWWWNTWTQTFHSCPPALYKPNPPLLLKIFPIACTEIWTGILASLSETFIHVSFYHLYHWAWEAPFSTPPGLLSPCES